MKIRLSSFIMIVLVLAACGPKTEPAPSGSIPPMTAEVQPVAPTAELASDSTVEPTLTSTPEPTQVSTMEQTSVSTLETTPAGQVLSGEAEVEIEDFAFLPGTITITAGTTVKWGNKDAVQHTVTADDGTWGSALLNKGDEFFFTFSQAGTYNYHCIPHPAMKGTIIVISS